MECLEDCFLYQNVILPTFQTSFGSESNLLDLVLSEDNSRISCLKHLPPLGGIEHGHHILTFNLNYKHKFENQSDAKKEANKFIFKNGNYKDLSNYFLGINWLQEFKDLDAKECYKKWLTIYNQGCNAFIPKFRNKTNMIKTQWMTKDLQDMIISKKRLWHKCKHAGFKNIEMVNEYKTLNKKIKKKVKINIREFEAMLAKNSRRNPKSVYSYLNSKTVLKDSIRALNNLDGSTTTDGLEIVNRLNDYFISVFAKEESLDNLSFPEKCEIICQDPNFEVDEVRKQLDNLNIHKTVGVDKVHPRVLKECSQALAFSLSIIFKKSFYSGVVPDEWLVANITPLFKKGNKLEPTNYRPVSLTSIVCKIMEKIIKNEMMEHLIVNKLLANEQHGFVNAKGCCSNLLEALDFITKAIEAGIDIDLIFLDFAKAFDSVSLLKLCCKLYAYGFRSHILNWCKAFLSDRQQRVVLGDFLSEWKDVTSGVPQGSVLGPLLFVIFINDLSVNIFNKLELFADDTKIIAKIVNESSSEVLQHDLNKLVKWSHDWSIKFNDEKCKVMHIGKTNPQFKYKMNEHTLQITVAERDLGLIISNDLNWEHHVISATSKANRALGTIKHASRYLDNCTFNLLYKSLVRPHLEYAATVWSPYWAKYRKQVRKCSAQSD